MTPPQDPESNYLGQFIPLHYHHNMLMDETRMTRFKSAIDQVVFPGAKVVELGGGTGVLSWFAAQKASRVWCVEFNPALVDEAHRLLALNPQGCSVDVVLDDAFHYLPPEPVDVVICEMVHAAMLREKLVAVINSFKQRYLARFGGSLPILMPEAVIMAVQPLEQDYCFEGFQAPIIQFQQTQVIQTGTRELAPPVIYSTLDFRQPTDESIVWQGQFAIEQAGTVNAFRFLTKNILMIDPASHATIDWLNHYLVIPLSQPVVVRRGDMLELSFSYQAGGSIPSLQSALQARKIS